VSRSGTWATLRSLCAAETIEAATTPKWAACLSSIVSDLGDLGRTPSVLCYCEHMFACENTANPGAQTRRPQRSLGSNAMTRILLLGTTGVEKLFAWNQLAQERARAAAEDGTEVPIMPKFLDFEKDFLKAEAQTLYSFLDDTEQAQYETWNRAWDKLAMKLTESDDSFAVAVHAVFVRDEFGTRSFLEPDKLTDLGFTHIVTLIDDVYSCWWRTEQRAKHARWVGRPTLSQLLQGRHAELLLGDLIARPLHLKNTMLSVLHPARVLSRLIFDATPPRTVYLSFPISGPRRRPDASGVDEISGYVARAAELERTKNNVISLCPLAIDELPLTRDRPIVVNDSVECVEFSPPTNRWNVSDFWPSEILLGSTIDEKMLIPQKQVSACAGAILDEVGVRDYRLLSQSNALAIFNPIFDGERPRGVQSEMERAYAIHRDVHIYQNPAYDADGAILREHRADPGTMGMNLKHRYSEVYDDLDAMLHGAFGE
jgi:hypothetical protein